MTIFPSYQNKKYCVTQVDMAAGVNYYSDSLAELARFYNIPRQTLWSALDRAKFNSKHSIYQATIYKNNSKSFLVTEYVPARSFHTQYHTPNSIPLLFNSINVVPSTI